MIGIVAGCAGGMLGIGGSVIIIPAMAFIFHDRAWHNQHMYQGAAMIVNLAVSLPATIRHHRARAIPWPFVRYFIPVTMVAILAGVLVSNLFPAETLRIIFGVFLLYVAISTVLKASKGAPELAVGDAAITFPRCGSVGLATGLTAGILGIGGGLVSVPLAQLVCRLPLRQCIAASAAAMVCSAPIGAALKISTLSQHSARWTDALIVAAALTPTALVGGYIGAGLTHRLPLTTVRLTFAGIVIVMAGRMLGLY